mgnify:CR=1 FL=1
MPHWHNDGVRVPIACTLTADQLPDRVEEWRSFLGTQITAVERDTAAARLRLAEGDDVRAAAADLAQREKLCCAFFDFAITFDGQHRWLAVSVPDDAAPVLDELLTLLPPALRPIA